jgi:hypothetical protein
MFIFLTVPQTSKRLLLLGGLLYTIYYFSFYHMAYYIRFGVPKLPVTDTQQGLLMVQYAFPSHIELVFQKAQVSLSHLILIFVTYLSLLLFRLKFLTN